MIEVKESGEKVRKHLAVDHLNFTIEEGHIYRLLGPNEPKVYDHEYHDGISRSYRRGGADQRA